MGKAADAFRTISEVAGELEVPKHVLRFWEAKFPQIRPMKRGGGRRYYRPGDMELLRGIRKLLHAEGYTIKGVQKILREQGIDVVKVHGNFETATKTGETGAKRSRRSARIAEAAVVAVRTSSVVKPQLAVSGRPPTEITGAELISAMIRELEACRRILLENETGVAPQRSARSVRAGGA